MATDGACAPEENQTFEGGLLENTPPLLLGGHDPCPLLPQLGPFSRSICEGVSGEDKKSPQHPNSTPVPPLNSDMGMQGNVPAPGTAPNFPSGCGEPCSWPWKNGKQLALEEKSGLHEGLENCENCTAFVNGMQAGPELQTALESLREDLEGKREVLEDIKDAFVLASEHVKNQANDTQAKIHEEFAKLHEFLRLEEISRIAALRLEEEWKSQMMKDKIDEITEDILILSDAISAIADQMTKGEAASLQKPMVVLDRADYPRQHPDGIGAGWLINVAEHLGNLNLNVWKRMRVKVHCTPVILDPNTADARLCVSADLTSVQISSKPQQVPDNPERYDSFACVLGWGGFSAGTHSWVVAVDDNTSWEVGVCTEATSRKGQEIWTTVWSVEFWDEEYYSRSPRQPEKTPLQVKERLQRIGVRLDLESGELVFFEPGSGENLVTHAHTFTDTLLPFFYNGCDRYPLTVLPMTD